MGFNQSDVPYEGKGHSGLAENGEEERETAGKFGE